MCIDGCIKVFISVRLSSTLNKQAATAGARLHVYAIITKM